MLYLFIYLFLGYLERDDAKSSINIFERYSYIGFISLSAIIVIYEVLVSWIGTHWYAPIQGYIEIFEGTQSPLMVLNSFFVFYIFKNLKVKYSRIINYGGRYSVGVFLIHGPGPLSRMILWDTILKGNVYWHKDTVAFICHYIFTVILLFIMGIIMDWLYTVTIERKLVDRCIMVKMKNRSE